MKLAELFGKGRTVFSCEVFPPKKTSPVDSIYKTLDGLRDIHPDFISVTFGAGGSQVNQSTREIAGLIQNQYHIPAMAHLTCVAAGREDVDRLLEELKAEGVENILGAPGGRESRYPAQDRLCPRQRFGVLYPRPQRLRSVCRLLPRGTPGEP